MNPDKACKFSVIVVFDPAVRQEMMETFNFIAKDSIAKGFPR